MQPDKQQVNEVDTALTVNIPANLLTNQIRQPIEPVNTKPAWVNITFNSLLTLYSTALITQLIAAIPYTAPLSSQFVPIAGTLILAVLTVAFILVKRGGLINLPINVLVVPLSAAIGLLVGL